MLRHKASDIVEFRQLEQLLATSAPAALAPERREALRQRIFSQLGEQEAAPAGLRLLQLRERWVMVPAGVSLAAAIIAGAVLTSESVSTPSGAGIVARAVGDVLVDGQPSADVRPGATLVARSSTWVSVGPDIRVGLDRGTVLRYDYSGGSVALHLFSGNVTVATNVGGVNLDGQNWGAVLAAGTLVSASTVEGQTTFRVEEGTAVLTIAGTTRSLGPGDSPVQIGGSPSAPPSALPSSRGATGSKNAGGVLVSGPASSVPTSPGAPRDTSAWGTTPPLQSPPDRPSADVAAAEPAAGAGGAPAQGSSGIPAGTEPAAPTAPAAAAGGSPGSSPAAPAAPADGGSSAPALPDPTAAAGNPHAAVAPSGNPHTAAVPTGNPHSAAAPTANPNAVSTPAPAATDPAPGKSGSAPGQVKKAAAPSPTPSPASTPTQDPAPGNSGAARGRNKS